MTYRKNADRYEILNRLAELWSRYPSWRLGQLLINAFNLESNKTITDLDEIEYNLFMSEDEELLKRVEGLEEEFRQ